MIIIIVLLLIKIKFLNKIITIQNNLKIKDLTITKETIINDNKTN